MRGPAGDLASLKQQGSSWDFVQRTARRAASVLVMLATNKRWAPKCPANPDDWLEASLQPGCADSLFFRLTEGGAEKSAPLARVPSQI